MNKWDDMYILLYVREILGEEYNEDLTESYINIFRSEYKDFEERLAKSLGNFDFVA